MFLCDGAKSLTWGDEQVLSTDGLLGMDYVAVAPAEMLAALEPLLALRASGGYTTVGVSLETVLDVFGGGVFGPAGIVRLSQAVVPRYLLLGAGTTYDPKNNLGTNTPAGIPCGWVQVYEGMASTDDLYSNGLATAVGRLPARFAWELTNAVQKIVAYTPGTKVVMFSDTDDSDSGTDRFADMQQALGRLVAASVVESTGRAPEDIRADLFAEIEAGARVVTYQGHGGRSWLGHDIRILGNEHAAEVPVSAWLLSTCLTGSYIVTDAEVPALSRVLLASAESGAVSALCSTRMGEAAVEHDIVKKSLLRMVKSDATWGDVLVHVKRELAGTETASVYTLLGDPALPALALEADWAIEVVAPAAADFVGAGGAVGIDFRLLGRGWSGRDLEVLYRRDDGAWVPIASLTTVVGKSEYRVMWVPPADGEGYQIMVRERD